MSYIFFYLLGLRIEADEFLILPLKLQHFGRCWEHTARAFTFYGRINFARGNFATSNWDFRSVTGDILVYRYTRSEESNRYCCIYDGGSHTRVIAFKS